ncbi:MAG TPA: DUF1684 domain-containing protein, partial [Rudaea sp.]|nr:DUF1684 domain-containing protein [Rudaea sp.]
MIHSAGMAIFAVLAAGVGVTHAGVTDDATTYHNQIESWRQHRVERLTAAHGWLSLVGLDWLKSGVNRIGSASDNDIVLAKGPAHLGKITLDNGSASIHLDTDADATINGKPLRSAALLDDSHENPTTVAFGSVDFYLVHRGDKYGLRIKDSNS